VLNTLFDEAMQIEDSNFHPDEITFVFEGMSDKETMLVDGKAPQQRAPKRRPPSRVRRRARVVAGDWKLSEVVLPSWASVSSVSTSSGSRKSPERPLPQGESSLGCEDQDSKIANNEEFARIGDDEFSMKLDVVMDRSRSPSFAVQSSEEELIDLIGCALWRLAVEKGGVNQAKREMKIPMNEYLVKVVRGLNAQADEVSDWNRHRLRSSLGFRLLVCGLVLLDRLLEMRKEIKVNVMNAHQLILTAIMIQSKFSEDEPLNNTFFSQIGKVSLGHLNQCELLLYVGVDMNVRVPEEEFDQVFRKLLRM